MQLFASHAAAPGTENADFTLPIGSVGVMLMLNISAVSGSPTLDVKLQVYDPVAAAFRDLTDSGGNAVAFAQKTGTGNDTLTCRPGQIEKLTLTGRKYSTAVPLKLRAVAVEAVGATTATFSLAAWATF